jgi:RimJ/RimL family protein N-acetyltransferase
MTVPSSPIGPIGPVRKDRTFADKPTIEGDRVVLRPMTVDDADAFFASMDAESARLTGTRRTFTIEEVRAWAGSRAATIDRLDLTILERTTGTWLGELAINDWNPDDHACNFRIALAPAGRDRGFGTEATRLIVEYVFTHLPIHRISLDVFAFNERAAHVYERVGFVREGVLRDHLYWDGEYHDTILMSILRPEWERAKADRDSAIP